MPKKFLSYYISSLLLLPLIANAEGTLVYLGKTAETTPKSVWLSILDDQNSGSYLLESRNKKFSESWSQSGFHSRVSYSTEGKNNGSPHSLYDSGNSIQLDGPVNQQGGISDAIPPQIDDLLPSHPIEPVPDYPIYIPILPSNPIEGVPDQPIYIPGTPGNPIEGIPDNPIYTPGTPSNPIEGVPDNPIYTPGTPSNPIEGVPDQPIYTPGTPSNPIEGVPDQPIYTPGTPSNPIEPIPDYPIYIEGEPSNPIEPTPEHPIETPNDAEYEIKEFNSVAIVTEYEVQLECPQSERELLLLKDNPAFTHCFENNNKANIIAQTQGREFENQNKLKENNNINTWISVRLTDKNDKRFNAGDISYKSGIVAIGIDTRISSNIILGTLINIEKRNTDMFNSVIKTDASGLNIGPYIGYRISNNWALDLSFLYGVYNHTIDISATNIGLLTGEYDSKKRTTMANLTGQYFLYDDIRIKPKLSFEYSLVKSDNYQLKNTSNNLIINIENNQISKKFVTFSLGLAKRYMNKDSLITQASIDFGARYDLDVRANDFSVVNQDLNPLSGEIRLTLDKQLNKKIFLRADVGYSSIGQTDIDEVSGGLLFSYLF